MKIILAEGKIEIDSFDNLKIGDKYLDFYVGLFIRSNTEDIELKGKQVKLILEVKDE